MKSTRNFVGRRNERLVVLREFERDAHHVQRIRGHPARPVALLDHAAVGQGITPVEDADIVEAEEAAREMLSPVSSTRFVHQP